MAGLFQCVECPPVENCHAKSEGKDKADRPSSCFLGYNHGARCVQESENEMSGSKNLAASHCVPQRGPHNAKAKRHNQEQENGEGVSKRIRGDNQDKESRGGFANAVEVVVVAKMERHFEHDQEDEA